MAQIAPLEASTLAGAPRLTARPFARAGNLVPWRPPGLGKHNPSDSKLYRKKLEMIATTYKTRLQKKELVAENTMAFYLEKPVDFVFKPGQYLDVSLINPAETDERGNLRSFSLASGPTDKYLAVATRIRDTAFKRVLEAIPLNAEVALEGPFGYFTLHHNPLKPAVFLAAGIGITPFLSMLRHAVAQKRFQQLYLFYENRRPEDAAFLSDLLEMKALNPNFRFIPTMTAMEHSQHPWSEETGTIDASMLSRYVTRLRGPIYYVAGPPAIVTKKRKMLVDAGISLDDVTTEEFVRYQDA
jgi:ferredoxin-NADP reductase